MLASVFNVSKAASVSTQMVFTIVSNLDWISGRWVLRTISCSPATMAWFISEDQIANLLLLQSVLILYGKCHFALN